VCVPERGVSDRDALSVTEPAGELLRTDLEQLLPTNSVKFSDGLRPIAPPDVLATFLGAFKIDPRRYLRDGEVMKDMLV